MSGFNSPTKKKAAAKKRASKKKPSGKKRVSKRNSEPVSVPANSKDIFVLCEDCGEPLPFGWPCPDCDY